MSGSRIPGSLKRLATGAAYVMAFLVPPVLVGAIGMNSAMSTAYEQVSATWNLARPGSTGAKRHDPTKPTAVVVMSNEGSQVTDVLAPYEVLARTDAFNLYAVAPTNDLVPLGAGLDLVPELSFAELDQRLNGADPDLIVVPAMPGARRDGQAGQWPVAEWLRMHAGAESTILSVCNGAEVLGEAGLLDGRRVTANWAGIDTYTRRYSAAEWVRGLRYVEDGNLISTAGITSGVSGTLYAVSKFLGEDIASELAHRIGYPDQRLDVSPQIEANRITFSDSVLFAASAGYGWGRPTIGVALTDGVGEIELASVMDVYPGQAYTADVTTLSSEGSPRAVTSVHGLTFVPRHGLDNADTPDRLLVPGQYPVSAPPAALESWARERGIRPEYIHSGSAGRFPFDPTLSDLAEKESATIARFNAKALEYPTDQLNLSKDGWPFMLLVPPIALGLLGLAAAVGIDRWMSRLLAGRRRRPAKPDDRGVIRSEPAERNMESVSSR